MSSLSRVLHTVVRSTRHNFYKTWLNRVSVNSKKHPICLLRGYLLYYALKCNSYPTCKALVVFRRGFWHVPSRSLHWSWLLRSAFVFVKQATELRARIIRLCTCYKPCGKEMSVSRSCLGNNLQWKSHNRDFTGTHIAYYNPFAPESPGNLPCGSTSLLPLLTSPVLIYTLTCAEWRDVSNHGRVSTIQSRLPEKKAKNHVMLTRKLPWKYCSTSHLPFLSSNRKIVRAFLKLFPPNEAYWMPSSREKMRQEKRKKRGERKRKVKVKTAMSLWNPKTWKLKFCFLRMPQLHKLGWIRGPLT